MENDTDVAPEEILNVSVSVRKDTVSVHGFTRDVFYSPEYLREYIYLYRAVLANRSSMEVYFATFNNEYVNIDLIITGNSIK